MTPLSGNTQRLQAVINTLRYVQANYQGVQDVYKASSTDATASDTDMKNTKKPMTNCLGDKGDKSVAADGKTLVGLVGGTLGRLRKVEGNLQRSKQKSTDANFPVAGLQQELNSLLQSSDNPEVTKALQQSIGWLTQGSQYHQFANQTAGSSLDYAWAGENKLATVGNSLTIVSKDNDQGKNVSGDMAAAKPAIDMAIGYVGNHAAQMTETVTREGNAINSLAQAQGWLAYALTQMQPGAASLAPPVHHASLQDVLHANDPTP